MQDVYRVIKGFTVLQVVINAVDKQESSQKWSGDDYYNLQ